MVLFNKKTAQDLIEEDENDFKGRDFKPAKTIIITPNKFNMNIEYRDNEFLKLCLGKKVIVGSIIWKQENSKKSSFPAFSDLDLEALGFLDPPKLIVTETIPSGIVQITDKTKIIFEKNMGKPKDISDDKIIEVKKSPNLKDYMEVLNLKDIIKIEKAGHYINKFEDKSKTIYFAHPYYFEELKK